MTVSRVSIFTRSRVRPANPANTPSKKMLAAWPQPSKLRADKGTIMNVNKFTLAFLVLPLAFTSLACPTRIRELPDASGEGGAAGAMSRGDTGGTAGESAGGAPGGAIGGHAGSGVTATGGAGLAGASGSSGAAGGHAGAGPIGGSTGGVGGGGAAGTSTGGSAGSSMTGAGGHGSGGSAGNEGGTGTGGARSCSPACVAPSGGTSSCVGSTCMPECNTAGQMLCNNNTVCVDLTTDPNNCGACGKKCEGYQYCAAGTCGPTYQMTRWLPTGTSQTGNAPQVVAAAEEANDDLILETGGTTVTLTAPTDAIGVTANDVGLARYTSNGALVWGRDLEQSLNTSSSQPVTVMNGGFYCPFTLAGNGDIVIVYERANPRPTGPVMQTAQFRLGRIDSNSVALLWESTLPLNYDATIVVPRAGRNDFVTFGKPPNTNSGVTGSIFEIPNGTGGTGANPNYLAPNDVGGAVSGKDGATIWEWTAQGEGSGQLNPWSSMTWTGGFGAAAIIGAQDGGSPTTSGNGTELGPWWSEGDYAPVYNQLAVDGNGDLLLSVTSPGLTRFNGGMPLVPTAGTSLVKISGSSGSVLWQANLPNSTFAVSTAPGNRIAVIVAAAGTAGGYGSFSDGNLPQTLSLYSGTDGSLLTSFPVGPGASVLAPGANDLYVLGVADVAADYNPGSGTDTGIAPAAFFSRYTF
jgi:hypothetical protein